MVWGCGGGVAGANSIRVDILSDSAGLPGAVDGSWFLGPLPYYNGSIGSIQPSQTISGITGITLTGGAQYWLAAATVGSLASDAWNHNGAGVTLSLGAEFLNTRGTWYAGYGIPGAFAVYGDPVSEQPVSEQPVPEPSTMLLLGTGLAVAVVMRRRMRQRA